jgi:5-formyltetrahydrofolate cyclo-ligase
MVVPPTSPNTAKSALRATFRTARAAFVAGLAPGERDRLNADLAAILDTNLGPGTVSGYSVFGDEIDPAGLNRALLYPLVNRDASLTFHSCLPADLVPGTLGVREPSQGSPLGNPDIVLVPLLAVDRNGNRIGYGGGHYDRTLAELRATRRVVAVGVAWDMQIVDTLLADPWDEPLDALATPLSWRVFTR